MGIKGELTLTLLVVSLLSPFARSANSSASEDLISALASAPLRTVYQDDAAADVTVTAVTTPDPSRQDAPAPVRAILDLPSRVIPEPFGDLSAYATLVILSV